MLASAVTLWVLPFILVCGARDQTQHLLEKRTSHLESRVVKKLGGAGGGGGGAGGGSGAGAGGAGAGGAGGATGEVDFIYRSYEDAEVSLRHPQRFQWNIPRDEYNMSVQFQVPRLTQCFCYGLFEPWARYMC